MFIADLGNQRIRKVNTLGIITTVAGNGLTGYSGDGGQAVFAEFNDPIGISIDLAGNLFIADGVNNRIRMINVSGIITTVAGNGVQGFSGDGGQATIAELNRPTDVEFDTLGNLYIADQNNFRVRLVCTGSGAKTSQTIFNNSPCSSNSIKEVQYGDNIFIYPNPSSGKFIIETTSSEKEILQVFDLNGRLVFSQFINGKTNIDTANLNDGIYSLTIKTAEGIINKKLIIIR